MVTSFRVQQVGSYVFVRCRNVFGGRLFLPKLYQITVPTRLCDGPKTWTLRRSKNVDFATVQKRIQIKQDFATIQKRIEIKGTGRTVVPTVYTVLL